MSTILVTGATGTIGRHVVGALLDAGASVRAAVRVPERATELRDSGAELVEFDYDRPETFAAAFDGVERAFILTPFVANFVDPVRAAVDSARSAGVRFLLRSTAHGADPQSPNPLARQHGETEQIVADSGIDWAVIQPTFFQDNVLAMQGHTIRGQGAFYGASAGGRTAYVASSDIGAVAAAILSDPGPHHGQRYVLTGPEAVTDEEVAGWVSEALGQIVRYVDRTPAEFAADLTTAGAPSWAVEAIVAVAGLKAAGWASRVSPAVEQITGRAPRRLADYVRRQAAESD